MSIKTILIGTVGALVAGTAVFGGCHAGVSMYDEYIDEKEKEAFQKRALERHQETRTREERGWFGKTKTVTYTVTVDGNGKEVES